MATKLFRVMMAAGWLALAATSAPAGVISTFDDGTLQGWTPDVARFEGTLQVDTEGNPGPGMSANDTGPSVSLVVQAPVAYTGDLSVYLGIAWDEFVFDYGASNSFSTGILLRGSDGTEYQAGFEMDTPREVWRDRFLEFRSDFWTLRTGSADFEDVIGGVAALFIGMDTSSRASGEKESIVDNIALVPRQAVPEPALWQLLVAAVAAAVAASRRRSRVSPMPG